MLEPRSHFKAHLTFQFKSAGYIPGTSKQKVFLQFILDGSYILRIKACPPASILALCVEAVVSLQRLNATPG